MANKYPQPPSSPMLDIIGEMLHQSYKAPDQNTLSEEGVKANGKKFKMECHVHGYVSLNHIAYRFDKPNGPDLFPYFNYVEGLKRICDYTLFVENQDNLYVITTELKDTKKSPKQQLDLTEPFVSFMMNRIRLLRKDFSKNISYRKVGVKTTFKKTTKGYKGLTVKNGIIYLSDSNNIYLKAVIDTDLS